MESFTPTHGRMDEQGFVVIMDDGDTATERDTATEDGRMDDTATERVNNDATIRLINDQLMVSGPSLRIQVEFNNGMWWEMPLQLSADLVQKQREGYEEASFVWDWADTRNGSWAPDGETTTFNRYVINFRTMTQRNIDNDRTRRVRFVHIVAEA